MKTLLSLDTKYRVGSWVGKTVREIIDGQYYAFKKHYASYSHLYDRSIAEYLMEVQDAIGKGRKAAYQSFRRYEWSMIKD